MYQADLFRKLNSSTETPTDGTSDMAGDAMEAWMDAGCRYAPGAGGCEHLTLSKCIRMKRGGILVIATGLVVSWWGCKVQKNDSMCLWTEVSEKMKERVASLDAERRCSVMSGFHANACVPDA